MSGINGVWLLGGRLTSGQQGSARFLGRSLASEGALAYSRGSKAAGDVYGMSVGGAIRERDDSFVLVVAQGHGRTFHPHHGGLLPCSRV